MPSKTVKLPVAEDEAFVLSPVWERIWRRQWVVDPPFLRRLREDIFEKVQREHLKYQADMAQFEAQSAVRHAQFMKNVSEMVGR